MAMNIGALLSSESLILVLAYAMNYGFNKPHPEAFTREILVFLVDIQMVLHQKFGFDAV